MKAKICRICNKEFPLTEEYFNTRKDGKDGFRNECKECKKKKWKEDSERIQKQRKEHYKINKERLCKYRAEHYQDNKEHFREQARKHYRDNKEYYSMHDKFYYYANKEKVSLRKKLYIKNNPTKAKMYIQKRRAMKRKLPATLTVEQWENIKKYFNNRCAYCGKELTLQQEHFIPLTKGGEYTINNIIPACKICNSSKNNKDFLEWYPKYKYYSKKREKFILKYLGYKDKEQQLTLID